MTLPLWKIPEAYIKPYFMCTRNFDPDKSLKFSSRIIINYLFLPHCPTTSGKISPVPDRKENFVSVVGQIAVFYFSPRGRAVRPHNTVQIRRKLLLNFLFKSLSRLPLGYLKPEWHVGCTCTGWPISHLWATMCACETSLTRPHLTAQTARNVFVSLETWCWTTGRCRYFWACQVRVSQSTDCRTPRIDDIAYCIATVKLIMPILNGL